MTDVGRLFQCYVHLRGNEYCRNLSLAHSFLILRACPHVIWSPNNCTKYMYVVTAGSYVTYTHTYIYISIYIYMYMMKLLRLLCSLGEIAADSTFYGGISTGLQGGTS